MVEKILIVCTGNQCRSPMAEAIFRHMVEIDPVLAAKGVMVRSAGTMPFGGSPATSEAQQTMKERGLDISSHRSRYLDKNIIDWADLILVMGEGHRQHIIRGFPDTANKISLLTKYVGEQGDIPDPIGNPLKVYQACANQLASLLARVVDHIKEAKT